MTKASKKFDAFFYFKPTQETSLGRGGNFLKWEGGNNLRIIPILKGIILPTYHFVMNRKRKGIQIFITIFIFVLFSAFSAYLHYNDCIETDFPSSKPRFENLDQDFLLTHEEQKLELLGSSSLTMIIETNFPEKFFIFSFQKSTYDQKTIILRCWKIRFRLNGFPFPNRALNFDNGNPIVLNWKEVELNLSSSIRI